MTIVIQTTKTTNEVQGDALSSDRDVRRGLRAEGFAVATTATLTLLLPVWVGFPLAGMVAALSFVTWARTTAMRGRFAQPRVRCSDTDSDGEPCRGFHRLDLARRWWAGCSLDKHHHGYGGYEDRPDINAFWEPKVSMIGIRLAAKVRGDWWEKARYWYTSQHGNSRTGPAYTRITAVWRSGRGGCGHPVVWRMSGMKAGQVSYGLLQASKNPAFAKIADDLRAEAATFAAMRMNKQVWRVLSFCDAHHPTYGSTEIAIDASLAPAYAVAGLKMRDAPRFRDEPASPSA